MKRLISQTTASFIANTRFELIPHQVVQKAQVCLFDFIGCVLGGNRTTAGRIGLAYARTTNGRPQSTLIGTGCKVCVEKAALGNALCGSALDIDDGHRMASGHPGAMVIPAALALAEKQRSTGRQLLEAIIVGYEVAIRCGAVMNDQHRERFYGSGGWAIYGTVAAAARLLELGYDQIRNALGICEVQHPFAMCLKSIPGGKMTKESVGWGCLTGFAAALLAQHGFTGPDEILDDPLFSSDRKREVWSTLGRDYLMLQTYIKRYASCRWTHPAIEAALLLKQEAGIRTEDLMRIEVRSFEKAMTLNAVAPLNTVQAQYSIPYTVAVALFDGKMGPDQVGESRIGDPDVVKLAGRIQMGVDPSLDKAFPEKCAAEVIFTTKNGLQFKRLIWDVKGSHDFPLSPDELLEKFQELASDRMEHQAISELYHLVCHLSEVPSIDALFRLTGDRGGQYEFKGSHQ